jgi:hypothetical protein
MIGYAEGEKMSREESEFPITRSSTSPSLKIDQTRLPQFQGIPQVFYPVNV